MISSWSRAISGLRQSQSLCELFSSDGGFPYLNNSLTYWICDLLDPSQFAILQDLLSLVSSQPDSEIDSESQCYGHGHLQAVYRSTAIEVLI